MKNKKLLTRLFALLASLVLVLALALPCFADTSSQTYDSLQFLVIDTDEKLSSFVGDHLSQPFSCVLTSTELDSYFIYGTLTEFSFVGEYADGSYINLVTINFHSNGLSTVRIYRKEIGAYSSEFTVYEYNDVYDSFEDAGIRLYILASSSGGGGSDAPASSDMYSNLFNILKDAVYGSDAELTGSQEYALTLISTILTYATILLPVILVIFIAVWCFKRF